MLTTAQYATLRDDIDNDRGSLAGTINTTMAALTDPTVTADQTIANLYNTVSGANQIAITQISKDEFLHTMAPVVIQIMADIAAGVPKSAKYQIVLQFLQMLLVIQLDNASLSATFANMISDGYITQDQINAITMREGTRAEHLFGAGVVLDHMDIAKAMGRGW